MQREIINSFIQSGNRCLCGCNMPSGPRSDNCTISCAGDPTQQCGNTNMNMVYATRSGFKGKKEDIQKQSSV